MKCKKCKTKLTKEDTFCPKCGQKVPHHGKWIVLGICLQIILLSGIIFAVWKGGWLDYIKSKKNAPVTNQDIVYQPDENDINFDEETAALYYDNMILVYTWDNLSESVAQKLADKVNGTVVGDISGIVNLLQIQVEHSSFDEIQAYVETLSADENVLYASYDQPIFMEETAASADDISDPWSENPKEPEQDRGNEENPAGTDWAWEAIGAYSAWKYEDYFTPINVGVYDASAIDTTHEELSGKISILDYCSNNSADKNHATSVTGIIAAKHNQKGIRGIADHAKIYFANKEEAGQLSDLAQIVEINKSFIENGCKVINNSWGAPHYYTGSKYLDMMIKAADGNFGDRLIPKNREEIKDAYVRYQAWMSQYVKTSATHCQVLMLELLLDKQNDFLFIQAAGNGENNAGPGLDAQNYAGYYAAITEDSWNEFTETYKDRLDALGITYEKVKEHILVVGATSDKKEDTVYQMSYLSNYGDTVDICAPGEKIFTCASRKSEETLVKYDSDVKGTSVAAPFVSGTVALVWSVDPSLTAGEVKDILLTNYRYTAVDEETGYQYPVLDAKSSVEAVVKRIEENKERENLSVHDQYTLAYENMTESGSWSEKLFMTVPMTVSGDGQSEQATIDMQSNTNVKGWKENDLSDLYLEGDCNISMEGSTAYAWTMAYKNGKAKYQYTVPFQRSVETEMDPGLFNFGELPQDAMQNAQIKDDQITFTIPGEYMDEVGLNATQMLSGLDDLAYGDISVTAEINKSDWILKAVYMKFSASMTYMGYQANAGYDIAYEFGSAGEFHDSDIENDQETGSVNPTGHQYEVYEYDSVTTWEEAKAFCENLGGHLAIISSQEENDYVYNLMRESGYESAYFGLTDKEEEGNWVCVDGTPAEYLNWNAEEPSNSYSGENYAMFYYKYTDGTWNDGDFDIETQNGGRAFICEFEE